MTIQQFLYCKMILGAYSVHQQQEILDHCRIWQQCRRPTTSPSKIHLMEVGAKVDNMRRRQGRDGAVSA